jgi:hypothetical protein
MESAYYQYGFWLRLLPKKVEYFISQDGMQFELVGSVENTLPIDQYGGQQRDFISEFEPRPARYYKSEGIYHRQHTGLASGSGSACAYAC